MKIGREKPSMRALYIISYQCRLALREEKTTPHGHIPRMVVIQSGLHITWHELMLSIEPKVTLGGGRVHDLNMKRRGGRRSGQSMRHKI
jgi:hypothetical protein